MPGMQDYINNRLPTHLTAPGSLWARDPLGKLTNTSQHSNKLRSQGRAGRDPKMAQWDYLYGGDERPPGVFDGPANTRKQKEQLAEFQRWGYNPSPGTRFDPSMGTVGGARQVVGTRPFTGEWWNDPALGGANPMSGGLDRYRFKAIGDLMKPRSPYAGTGGSVSADGGGGGDPSIQGGKDQRSNQSAVHGDRVELEIGETDPKKITRTYIPIGETEPITEYVYPQDDNTTTRRTTRVFGNNQAASGPTFGEPMTPMAKAIQVAMEEAALGNFGQARALINNGIMGPAAMQKLLELIEDRENRVLMDLPGRVSDRLATNKANAADAKRMAVRGLEGSLGPLGAQRPGLAAQIASTSAVPVVMDESRRASSITENAKDFADQVFVGQGTRRSDLLKENIKSKVLGLQLMSSATGQGQGLIGERYWDTDNPLDSQYAFQSGLMDQQAGINSNAAYQQFGYGKYMSRLSSQLRKNEAGYNARLQLWLEQMFEDLGLGQYYESAADYIDAFMPDSVSFSSRRYKEEIESIDIGLSNTLKLRPVKFKWKATGAEGVGFIAEEVAEVYPDLVVYDEQGRPDAVKYGKIIKMLLLANRG